MPATILVRGGGDLASGVAVRLYHSGLNVVISELEQPVAVRRTVSFSEAIYEGQSTVEDVTGRKVADPTDMLKIINVLSRRQIPVLIDPDCQSARTLHPLAIVDARMLKRPPESLRHTALLYIGLGPGFRAPDNCQVVIETQRGHRLGRVIWSGASLSDTTKPDGDARRVLRSPADGTFESAAKIGQHFDLGAPIASVGDAIIAAPFSGVLRGLLRPGLPATKGMKIGDIDSRDDPSLCNLVSDKALAVGGGVLEALLTRPEVHTKLWA
ncbi:MAG TPA: selenium-dependent molybdenum cofactor biosynthesis protein YqeB [Anaerolineales bacterium]